MPTKPASPSTTPATASPGIVPPRWAVPASLSLAGIGLVVSLVLAYETLSTTEVLYCPVNSTIDCAKVTSSAWSTLFGIPVAYLGVAFFVGMIALSTRRAWQTSARWVHVLRLTGVSVGMVMVLYLVWAELYKIGAICLWCTAVHVTTFLLFCVVVFAWVLREEPSSAPAMRPKSRR